MPRFTISIVRSGSIHRTSMYCVLTSRERTINFYKKTGFKKIGNHDFQIGKENFEFIAMLKIMA